jgi:hypothetical protein
VVEKPGKLALVDFLNFVSVIHIVSLLFPGGGCPDVVL